MNAAERRRFVLDAAAAMTDEPGTVHLLAMRNGRKERIGSASLTALRTVAASNPDSFDRRAFCVRAAGDLLVLDADDHAAAAVARQVAERAEGLGLEPVVATSGRPGNLHVYVRVVDDRLREVLSALASEGGVDVRTGNWVRPPLSTHPEGHHGELLEPSSPAEALRRLSRPQGAAPPPPVEKPPVAVPARAERRRFVPALSAAMLRVLRDGDGNPDRSVTLQRVVTAMVNRGWTIDAAWHLLTKPTSRCAAKLHDKIRNKGEDEAFRYLEHCWRSAEEFCSSNPAVGSGASEAIEALDRLAERADAVPWPGASGSNTWMVLHQMIEIARRAGTLTPTISQRQLAEACSLSRGTVHLALTRLLRDGWIVQLKKGSGPKASLWELAAGPRLSPVPTGPGAAGEGAATSAGAVPLELVRDDPEPASRRSDPLAHPHPSPAGGVRSSGPVLRGSHDAFRSAALGALGYRVLRHLRRHGPCDAATIAAALGCHTGSVARLLRSRLGAVGLVERLGGGRWGLLAAPVEAALDWAARRFGTAGLGERQRRFHEWEREEYRRSPSWGLDQEWWDQWETTRQLTGSIAA